MHQSGIPENFKRSNNRTMIHVKGELKVHKSFVIGLLIFKQIKPKRCYWMTASLNRKYNAFSNRESAQTEQKHMNNSFVGLPDHVYFY